MLELPDDWDGLHLGGHSPSGGVVNYSNGLYKSIKTWGGYGYILNRKVMPKLIELLTQEQTQVDTYYTWIMKDLNWFKSKEMLVYHLAGYSEIEKKHRDIKELYIIK